MNKYSTPNDEAYCNARKKDRSQNRLGPRKKTMELILQFAKVYHAERKLPESLAGIVLN